MSSFTMTSRQKGQGLTEYAIVVALVAVAAIGVMGFFGDSVTVPPSGFAQELAGYNVQAEQDAAGDAAIEAPANGVQTTTREKGAATGDP